MIRGHSSGASPSLVSVSFFPIAVCNVVQGPVAVKGDVELASQL